MTEKVCFEFLQVAIGNRKSLSTSVSDTDWHRLFDFCKKQALVRIGSLLWVLHEVFAMPTHYYVCEPDGKEGRKLLAEIMQGGNFGQYEKRDRNMRNGSTIPHAIWKFKRVTRLVSSYPEEALCEPFFRVWHWGWRLFH